MTLLLACLLLSHSQVATKEESPLYSFVAYGDTRGHGPDDHDTHVQQAIVAGALELKPALILQTGDLVFDSSVPKLWDQFDVFMKPVWAAGIPYYPARGNHDDVGTSIYLAFMKKRIVPTWHGHPRTKNLLNYAVDKAPLRFIAIDTETSTAPSSKQYKWIESELAAAEKRGLAPIPMFHIAIHSIGNHGTNEKKQAELQPLFEKYHVPLVFQGHDHIYYRTRRHGTVYVVTGGGGAPLYDLHPGRDPRDEASDPTDPSWPDVSVSAYHYCACDVFKDHIDVTVRAVDYNGPNPIDTFTIPLPALKGKG